MLGRVATVLIPIPDMDFDPTEVAVSWQVLTGKGHVVVFATESGRPAAADDIMLSGRGLDVWSRVPGLGRVVVVGRFLRANGDARAAYAQMLDSEAYRHPIAWTDARLDDVEALPVPGGHRARGMRSYIDSEVLQALVVEAFRRPCSSRRSVTVCSRGSIRRLRDRPLGAIRPQDHCAHMGFRKAGVAVDPQHEVLGPRLLPDLFRPRGRSCRLMSVEAEVTRALENPGDFCNVPRNSPNRRKQTSGMVRDTATDSRPAFVVDDGSYISARWPGDTHAFAATVSAKLHEKP